VIFLFPALNFVKIFLLKNKWCPKTKVKVNVFNLSDKLKILDLLKGNVSLAEVSWSYGIKESNICSTVLKSMHSKHP
jgi:hypothetical protein